MAIFHQLATATLPLIPKPIMRKLAGRYIAGETQEEALSEALDDYFRKYGQSPVGG